MKSLEVASLHESYLAGKVSENQNSASVCPDGIEGVLFIDNELYSKLEKANKISEGDIY